jgi:DNA-binding response OmpR family regulator
MMSTNQNTILLVEEDPSYVLLVKRAAHKANLSVSFQVVGDMETAICYLSGQGCFADRERYPLPKLIATNIKLPDRPGLELLAWVRQQPKLKSLPVVVLSSMGEVGEADNAKDLCASAYFVKPLPLNDLIDALKDIMSHFTTLQDWQTWNWR